MTSSTELLGQFRALGGIAENVCIRQSQHGHGLFVVTPSRIVRVVTPSHLLLSPKGLVLTPYGHVKVQPESGACPAVMAFHESYLSNIGWNAGGLEHHSQFRQTLCALPASLKNFLQIFGCTDDLSRPPTPQEALNSYCISRQISVNGDSILMPVLELINHANDGAPYVIEQDGVSLSGIFQDEVVARYTRQVDAFHFFFNYHFAARSRSALSCSVKIDVPGFRALRISRLDGLSEVRNGIRGPQIRLCGDEIHLSFVELVNLDEPPLPRQKFLELLVGQGMAPLSVHQLFDGLLGHNRQVLQDLLDACESAECQVIRDLKTVAGYQLNNLTLC